MTDFDLFSQAAASAANVPSAPLLIELAKCGFDAIRNAGTQATLSDFELDRSLRRAGTLRLDAVRS